MAINFGRFVETVKKKRFDGKPDEVVYYANGEFFDRRFMKYYFDPFAMYVTTLWVQSGYTSVEELKRFSDFQERQVEEKTNG